MRERTQQAIKFFMNKGLSKVAATGIVGNLLAESGLRTNAINPGDGNDGSDSIGIAQWNGKRAQGLRAFASSRGADFNDFGTQLEYVWYELNTTERSALERLMAAQSVDDATAAMVGYERPAGWTPDNPRGAHSYATRLQHAQAALGLDGAPMPRPEGTPIANVSNPYSLTGASPNPYDMYERQKVEEERESQRVSWWDAAKEAPGTWAGVWAYRQLSGRVPDGTFTPDFGEFEKERAPHILERYYDYVLSAHSAEDYEARYKKAMEDTEYERRLAQSGIGAKATDLIVSALDPSALPIMILSEGAAAPVMAAAKLGRVGRILWRGALAGAENAAFEAASSKVNPNVDPLTDPLIAFGVGAVLGGGFGAISRSPHFREEAATLARAGESILKRTESEGLSTASPLPGTLSAAANHSQLSPTLSGVPELDLADAPFSAINGAYRTDSAGQGLRSESALMRHLTAHTVEDGVGLRGVDAAPDVVSMDATRNVAKMRHDWYSAVGPSFQAWMKDNRIPFWQKDRAWDTFFSDVSYWVEEPTIPKDVSKHVRTAVGEFRRIMSDYVDRFANPMAERGGVGRPVAELVKDALYLPKIADYDAVVRHVNEHGEARMVQFLRNAILSAKPDLDFKLAMKIAQGYLKTLRQAAYGIEDRVAMAIHRGSREELKEAFTDRVSGKLLDGLTDQDIDEIVEAFIVGGKETPGSSGGGLSSRFKRRTMIDYRYAENILDGNGKVVGRIDMRNLFDRNADRIMNRYIRQAEGRLAFARMQIRDPKTGELIVNGVVSKSEWEKLINFVRDEHGRRMGDRGDIEWSIKRDTANLSFWWDAITGTPTFDQGSRINQWVLRLGKFNFIRLMNNMGLNQAQEISRAFGQIGLKAMMSQMPTLRRIITTKGRSLPKNDELLAELEAGTGLGMDWDFGDFRYREDPDKLGSLESAGRFTRGVDRLLLKGQQLTAHVSLMTHIQSYEQKWVAKAAAQKLYDMARRLRTKDGTFDFSRLRGKDMDRLRDLGMNEETASRIFQAMLDHAKTPKGRKLAALNLHEWAPADREKLLGAIHKMTHRVIHQNDVGSLHRFMAQPTVKLLTQFRSFVIGSWVKATLHNIAHFDARTFTTMMLEMMAAAVTYTAYTAALTSGRSDQKELLEERLSLGNIAKAAFSRSAFASIVPGLIDGVLGFTPIGQQFNYRTSQTASSAIFGNPTWDLIDNLQRATRGSIGAALTDDELTQGTVKSGLRTLPFGNFLGYMPLLNLMTDDLPERN